MMKEAILEAFQKNISQTCFVEESSLVFGVFDPASEDANSSEKCHIVHQNQGHLKVDNPQGKLVHLLAIDGCLFDSTDHQKCDLAIFDDKQFCFAEIKNVKTKLRRAAKKEAKDQLYTTIGLFKAEINFDDYYVIALIALTFEKSYPAARVDSQDARIRFEDNYNVELREGNSISFS